MSDLFLTVQFNFQQFWGQLKKVHDQISLNFMHASLDTYQTNFLKIVVICMLTPLLWKTRELFFVQNDDETQYVFVNAVFPTNQALSDLHQLEKLKSKRKYVEYSAELEILCWKTPQLTYLCNLFSILSAWQLSTELYQRYFPYIDSSSFLFKALPLQVSSITNPSFLLNLQCRLYVYELFKLMHNNPNVVSSVQQQFSSPHIKTAIRSNNWTLVTYEIEKILNLNK